MSAVGMLSFTKSSSKILNDLKVSTLLPEQVHKHAKVETSRGQGQGAADPGESAEKLPFCST